VLRGAAWHIVRTAPLEAAPSWGKSVELTAARASSPGRTRQRTRIRMTMTAMMSARMAIVRVSTGPPGNRRIEPARSFPFRT